MHWYVVRIFAISMVLGVVRGDLGRLALEKVLRDGREIFGDIPAPPPQLEATPYAPPASSKHATWMTALPDDTPLTQLTIPGTHDSATWNYSQATQDRLMAPLTQCGDYTAPPYNASGYRCQSRDMALALESGIRFFDLRFAMDPAGIDVAFWHADALLSARAKLEDVLFGFYAWLAARPGETVLLSLQCEHGCGSEIMQRAIFDVLTSDAAGVFISSKKGELGTLGEARGKIILFRRFDLDNLLPAADYEDRLPGLHLSPSAWLDNGYDFALVYNETTGAAAYIEDYYSPVEPGKSAEDIIAAKFAAVRSHLRRAASADLGNLFITFTSGTRVDVDVTPRDVALGSRVGNVTGVNRRLRPLLGKMKGERLGIVVMDFFQEPEGLIDLLLGS